MRISSIRGVSFGSLCAAITLLTLPGHSARAQESPAAQSIPAVSEMYDKDFAKHVEIRLLGVAWQNLDAKLMTDVALQLREGERVLGRKHPKISSRQILNLAAKVAADGGDQETLERLVRVAAANGDETEVTKLKKLQSLAGKSRSSAVDLGGTPIFSADDINQGAVPAFGNMLMQIRAAKVSGARDALTSLPKGAELLSSLRDSHRSRLKEIIDEAVESIGEADDSIPAIQLLIRDSRVLTGPAGPAKKPSTDGAAATAFTAGGMKYVMTEAGAFVLSRGRIGSVVLAPGDVIRGVAGNPLSAGETLDQAISNGYLSGNRSLFVSDGQSGQAANLSY
ncbi:MAG: hypothetical protein KDB14_10950 [Planctomycetales bacterium]|nr:hypothetical protein [Planctomycetales bacterium]